MNAPASDNAHNNTSPPPSAEEFFVRLNKLISLGQDAQARALCLELLRLYPDNARAHALQGDFAAQHRQLQEALICYQRAVRLEPHNAEYRRKYDTAISAVYLPGNADTPAPAPTSMGDPASASPRRPYATPTITSTTPALKRRPIALPVIVYTIVILVGFALIYVLPSLHGGSGGGIPLHNGAGPAGGDSKSKAAPQSPAQQPTSDTTTPTPATQPASVEEGNQSNTQQRVLIMTGKPAKPTPTASRPDSSDQNTSNANGGNSGEPPPRVVNVPTVPDVNGRALNAGMRQLRNAGYNLSISESASTDVSAGAIIRTDPPAGCELARGGRIIVYVASAPAPMPGLPNYTGMSSSDAQAALRQRNYNVTIIEEANDNVARGRVIRTAPPSGSTVAVGDRIKLFVSSGRERNPWDQ